MGLLNEGWSGGGRYCGGEGEGHVHPNQTPGGVYPGAGGHVCLPQRSDETSRQQTSLLQKGWPGGF